MQNDFLSLGHPPGVKSVKVSRELSLSTCLLLSLYLSISLSLSLSLSPLTLPLPFTLHETSIVVRFPFSFVLICTSFITTAHFTCLFLGKYEEHNLQSLYQSYACPLLPIRHIQGECVLYLVHFTLITIYHKSLCAALLTVSELVSCTHAILPII